jgi:hypothetical protein
MAASISDLIDRTIALLNQGLSNQAKMGTVSAATIDGSGNFTTLKVTPVDGVSSHSGPALFDIAGRLVFASSYDSNTEVAVVPSWGNGVDGSPGFTTGTLAVGTKVIIDPLWSRWNTGVVLMDSITSLYPRLFQVKKTTLTSTTVAERYSLPTDAEELLKVQVEGYGPSFPRRIIKHATIDTVTGGVPELSIRPIGLSGRPIHVWYKAKPVLPTSPLDGAWTWTDSGLPDSSEGLPILRAAMTMIMAPELAKQQTFSAPQTDNARFIQAGAGNAASRRLEELFEKRMNEEMQKLHSKYHIRPRLQYNG